MWTIRRNGDGWEAVRSRRGLPTWAGAILFTLGVLWALGGLGQIFSGNGALGIFTVIFAGGLLVTPGLLLIWKFAALTAPIVAVLDSKEIPGGVYVTVIDDKQVRREMLTDAATASALAASLAAPGR